MKVLMQNCGRAINEAEYQDWKAGQEAIKDVTGLLFSYYDLSSGKITAFYKLESLYGLKRGQKVVEI